MFVGHIRRTPELFLQRGGKQNLFGEVAQFHAALMHRSTDRAWPAFQAPGRRRRPCAGAEMVACGVSISAGSRS
jgi:hypothetical protein